jgi:multidrug resistance efflux pump
VSMQPVAEQQNDGAVIAAKRRSRRGRPAYLLVALATALGLSGFGGYVYVTRNIETTDDAHIEADVVPMSPRVGGQMVRVAVADDQTVKSGELLIEVDPAPYQARLEQAEAQLSIAQANIQAAGADARRLNREAARGDHVGVGDDARQLIDQGVVVRAVPIIGQFAGKERG